MIPVTVEMLTHGQYLQTSKALLRGGISFLGNTWCSVWRVQQIGRQGNLCVRTLGRCKQSQGIQATKQTMMRTGCGAGDTTPSHLHEQDVQNTDNILCVS